MDFKPHENEYGIWTYTLPQDRKRVWTSVVLVYRVHP